MPFRNSENVNDLVIIVIIEHICFIGGMPTLCDIFLEHKLLQQHNSKDSNNTVARQTHNYRSFWQGERRVTLVGDVTLSTAILALSTVVMAMLSHIQFVLRRTAGDIY